MHNKNSLIELEALSKSFGQTEVLHTINLTINEGEFTAIQGPSGCGKSTLLSLIGLLDMQWQGHYRLAGTSVESISRAQLGFLRNRHIGWIFQNFNLIGDLNLIENVSLPLRYGDHGSLESQRERAIELLTKVGLQDKLSAYPHELSGGQQQRVAIARALITSPSLLLADEPTGNLDSANAKLIFDVLLELNREGTTIIMVTHDPALAAQCSVQVSMLDGRIISVEE